METPHTLLPLPAQYSIGYCDYSQGFHYRTDGCFHVLKNAQDIITITFLYNYSEISGALVFTPWSS